MKFTKYIAFTMLFAFSSNLALAGPGAIIKDRLPTIEDYHEGSVVFYGNSKAVVKYIRPDGMIVVEYPLWAGGKDTKVVNFKRLALADKNLNLSSGGLKIGSPAQYVYSGEIAAVYPHGEVVFQHRTTFDGNTLYYESYDVETLGGKKSEEMVRREIAEREARTAKALAAKEAEQAAKELQAAALKAKYPIRTWVKENKLTTAAAMAAAVMGAIYYAWHRNDSDPVDGGNILRGRNLQKRSNESAGTVSSVAQAQAGAQ